MNTLGLHGSSDAGSVIFDSVVNISHRLHAGACVNLVLLNYLHAVSRNIHATECSAWE